MRKIIYIVITIILNILLFFAGLVIFNLPTERYVKTVDFLDAEQLQLGIYIVLLLATAVTVSVFPFKWLRNYTVGLAVFLPAILVFMIFYLNHKVTWKGEYKTYRIIDAEQWDDKSYLDVEFTRFGNRIEVTQDKCFKLDSVQIRIDRGLFGMGVLTNHVQIQENYNCINFVGSDSMINKKKRTNAGHFYSAQRCFDKAIEAYSQQILDDLSDPDNYYHRGTTFMLKKDYKNALKDFYAAAYIKYKQLDSTQIQDLHADKYAEASKKLNDAMDSLLLDNKSKIDFKTLQLNMQYLSLVDDFDTYQQRILFCIEKLKTTEI